MKRMTAGTRITLGLVCSMVGILMMAHYLGILPDREQLDIGHRQQTSETMALSAAAMLANEDHRGLEAVLNGLVKRRDDLESVAVVSSDDGIVIAAGEHAGNWPKDLGSGSNDQYMQVPLARPDDPEWGRIEFRFTPLLKEGFLSSLRTQFYGLLVFCALLAFFAFRTFLRFVMKNLDPSRAVSRRVRESLDILAEGLMIVGVDGRILLANNALAELTGNAADRMIGKKASTLGFKLTAGSGKMPWERALAEGKRSRIVRCCCTKRRPTVRSSM
jgi:PAS domain-containing protein